MLDGLKRDPGTAGQGGVVVQGKAPKVSAPHPRALSKQLSKRWTQFWMALKKHPAPREELSLASCAPRRSGWLARAGRREEAGSRLARRLKAEGVCLAIGAIRWDRGDSATFCSLAKSDSLLVVQWRTYKSRQHVKVLTSLGNMHQRLGFGLLKKKPPVGWFVRVIPC